MARRAKIRLAGTLSAILPSMLLCGAATSQTIASTGAGLAVPAGSDGVANMQVQDGDVFAGQQLNVVDATGAALATTAVGNSVSAIGTGTPLGFSSRQTLNGSVNAEAELNGAGYVNNVLASTAAAGNSATAGTCCGALSGSSTQTIAGGKSVTASTTANLNYADSAGVDSTAVGNSQGWNSYNGSANVSSTQTHGGSTRASTRVKAYVVYGDAAYTASAVGNNVSGDTHNGPVAMSSVQATYGTTEADVAVKERYAYNLVGAATATANNVNVAASEYGASLSSQQTNTGDLGATADVNLASWYGSGTAQAYGMANSAILSNAGSYAGVENAQSNSGQVGAYASFTGGTGGDGFASATAVGNAVSGYACPECNGTLSANNSQTNTGGVRATSTFTSTAPMGTATGVATAVGNTATFQVRKSGG